MPIPNRILSTLCLSAFLSTPFLTHAQTAELAIPAENFLEGYSGRVNVSSAGALVGLRIGSIPNWSADSVTLFPQKESSGVICLRSSSLDGRFWAENPYKFEGGNASTLVGPITKTFKKHLQKYPKNEVTFRATIADNTNCSSREKSYLVPTVGKGNAELSVYLNSGNRRTFGRLYYDDEQKKLDVVCEPINGFSSVIADRICRINVQNVKGNVELKVAFINLTGQKDFVSYNIRLPDFAATTE